MNDLLWDIFYNLLAVISFLYVAFIVVIIIIGIKEICNTNKPKKKKKKYYLIKYALYCKHEIIIKAKSPLEARLKFHKEYPMCDLISLKEIKDE